MKTLREKKETILIPSVGTKLWFIRNYLIREYNTSFNVTIVLEEMFGRHSRTALMLITSARAS